MTGSTLWQTPLEQILEQTAAPGPNLGGGSVPMIGASLGLGLVLMALRVTRAKAAGPDLDRLLDQAQDLLARMQSSVEGDVAAFAALMAALRRPRDDPDRAAALEAAALAACEAPLAASRLCGEAISLASQARRLVKADVMTDVEAAAELMEGAGLGVLCVIDANLRAVRDTAKAQAVCQARRAQADELRARTDAFRTALAPWDDD